MFMKDNGMIVVLVHQINASHHTAMFIVFHLATLPIVRLTVNRPTFALGAEHACTHLRQRLTPKRHLTDVDDKGKTG
jgi:hypothetical protein